MKCKNIKICCKYQTEALSYILLQANANISFLEKFGGPNYCFFQIDPRSRFWKV